MPGGEGKLRLSNNRNDYSGCNLKREGSVLIVRVFERIAFLFGRQMKVDLDVH